MARGHLINVGLMRSTDELEKGFFLKYEKQGNHGLSLSQTSHERLWERGQ
jgi:hypothetical protein